jgi:hypothetical protein
VFKVGIIKTNLKFLFIKSDFFFQFFWQFFLFKFFLEFSLFFPCFSQQELEILKKETHVGWGGGALIQLVNAKI